MGVPAPKTWKKKKQNFCSETDKFGYVQNMSFFLSVLPEPFLVM